MSASIVFPESTKILFAWILYSIANHFFRENIPNGTIKCFGRYVIGDVFVNQAKQIKRFRL